MNVTSSPTRLEWARERALVRTLSLGAAPSCPSHPAIVVLWRHLLATQRIALPRITALRTCLAASREQDHGANDRGDGLGHLCNCPHTSAGSQGPGRITSLGCHPKPVEAGPTSLLYASFTGQVDLASGQPHILQVPFEILSFLPRRLALILQNSCRPNQTFRQLPAHLYSTKAF